jgi:glycosyltransferase involved in cell wall biosynthesis
LKQKHPTLKLVFAGTGETMNDCIALSRSLGLNTFVNQMDVYSRDADVFFLGFQHNPLVLMKHARLFTFPTYYEGLPNALIEALICGAIVVSSDCPTGPREILAPSTSLHQIATGFEISEYGILVEPFDASGDKQKVDHWVKAIDTLLSDEALFARIQSNLKNRAAAYRIDHILPQWKACIDLLVSGEN